MADEEIDTYTCEFVCAFAPPHVSWLLLRRPEN